MAPHPSAPLDPYEQAFTIDDAVALRDAIARGYQLEGRDPVDEHQSLEADAHALVNWIASVRVDAVAALGVLAGDLIPYNPALAPTFGLSASAQRIYLDVEDYFQQKLQAQLRAQREPLRGLQP